MTGGRLRSSWGPLAVLLVGVVVVSGVLSSGCLETVSMTRTPIRSGVLDEGWILEVRLTWRCEVDHRTQVVDGVERARNDYRGTLEVAIPGDPDTVSRTQVDSLVVSQGVGQSYAANGLPLENTGSRSTGSSVELDSSVSLADQVALNPSLVGFQGVGVGSGISVGIPQPEDRIRAWVDESITALQGAVLFMPMFVVLHIEETRDSAGLYSMGSWDLIIPIPLHVPSPLEDRDVVLDIPLKVYIPFRTVAASLVDVSVSGSQNTGWAWSTTGDYSLGWETYSWTYPVLDWIYDQVRTLSDGSPDAAMDSHMGKASSYSSVEGGYRVL